MKKFYLISLLFVCTLSHAMEKQPLLPQKKFNELEANIESTEVSALLKKYPSEVIPTHTLAPKKSILHNYEAPVDRYQALVDRSHTLVDRYHALTQTNPAMLQNNNTYTRNNKLVFIGLSTGAVVSGLSFITLGSLTLNNYMGAEHQWPSSTAHYMGYSALGSLGIYVINISLLGRYLKYPSWIAGTVNNV